MATEEKKTENKLVYRGIHLIIRGVVAVAFLVLGGYISNISFFTENPLFGITYLATILISLITGLLGFFIIPDFFLQLRIWIEDLIEETVYEALSGFWEQQSKKSQDARKEKEDKKEQELKDRLENGLLLDTSVLVDGRIIDIFKTGFLCDTIIVPQFVLEELQKIADSKDSLKRKKGRRGLKMAKDLKKVTTVYTSDETFEGKDVDVSLVELAKKYKLRLMTLDFNLNGLAQASDITVLNINELVNAIRPQVLPGEKMKVKIVQEGKEKDQGVGYLDDGTMVVVKKGKEVLGKIVEVEVTKVLQSEAGKMLFAFLVPVKKEKKAKK